MDPISGFSLAASVITFVELGRKIIAVTQQIREHGRTDEQQDLYLVRQDLANVKKELEDSLVSSLHGARSEHELSLHRLAGQSQQLCGELLKLLAGTKWLQTAVKTVWNEGRVAALQRRFDNIRQELILSLLMSFRSVRTPLNTYKA